MCFDADVSVLLVADVVAVAVSDVRSVEVVRDVDPAVFEVSSLVVV